jgi:hypothetical protein
MPDARRNVAMSQQICRRTRPDPTVEYATKKPGIARFYFGSGTGDLTGRSLIITAQTSLERDRQCDSVGPA